MAAQATNKEKDRRIIHCLLCQKPQEVLTTHLARVCMKNKSKRERKAEVQRAKDSVKAWTRQGRNWDYNDLCRLIPHRPSRLAILRELRRRNSFIANPPNKADLEPEGEQPSSSTAAVQPPPPVIGSTEQTTSPGEETSSSSHSIEDPHDPTRQSNKQPRLTRQTIRRVVKTESSESFSESKPAVAKYMANMTLAEPYCRMRTRKGKAEVANLFSSLSGSSSSSEKLDEGGSRSGMKSLCQPADHHVMNFDAFVEAFPVTVDGKPPTKRQRAQAGFSMDRVLYDEWRTFQFAKRRKFLLSKYTRYPPTIRKMNRLIKNVGWTANYPKAEDIAAKWTPVEKAQLEMDPKIMRSIKKQKWKGLAIKDFGGSKGEGVVTTRAFAKGSIICDYHGTIIDAAVGNQRMEAIHDNKYYFFFFKHGGQALCVDAQASPCQCHPDKQTFGRIINHSKKKFNVKPIHCMMKFSDGEEHTILFRASRDITVDEELLFEYGVRRRSEGVKLKWLDD